MKQTAFAGAGLVVSSTTAQSQATQENRQVPQNPIFGISLAEWSLHRALFARKLDHLDFPKASKQHYGIDAIELVNQFFKDKGADQKYLAEFKRRADDLGVRILLIMCDGEGHLGDADAAMREQAVGNHHKWIDAAKYFGCHSIRVNANSTGTKDEQKDRIADGLHRLSEYAAKSGLNVLVENHGELSSNAPWLVSVIKQVGLPNCGTLPDFGNWYEFDRYQGVAQMMPLAKAVSAKSHDFDGDGNELHTDYRRMLKIVLDAGYHGWIGIEYEGEKLGEPEGIRATKTLLEKIRAQSPTPPPRQQTLN